MHGPISFWSAQSAWARNQAVCWLRRGLEWSHFSCCKRLRGAKRTYLKSQFPGEYRAYAGSRAAFLAEVWRVARPRRGNGEAGASSAGDAQRLEPCWRLRYNCRSGGTWLVAFTMFGVGIVATTGRV